MGKINPSYHKRYGPASFVPVEPAAPGSPYRRCQKLAPCGCVWRALVRTADDCLDIVAVPCERHTIYGDPVE